MDLLVLHPRYAEKVGIGVQSISIKPNKYAKRTFILHRMDNSQEEFSYIKCVDGDHKPFDEFSRACRRSVEERLHDWKATKMDGRIVKCAISGEIVTFTQAHVDHKPPLTFSVIVKGFAVSKGINLSDVRYTRKGIIGVEFTESALTAAFDIYHSKMAVLRIVRSVENLRTSYAARVTATAKDDTLG